MYVNSGVISSERYIMDPAFRTILWFLWFVPL